MRRPAYPKYKPSGVEWVDSIPEHWDILKLKHCASVQFSSVDKHTKEDEEPVRLCNYVDVYHNDFIRSSINFMAATATPTEIIRYHIRRGDVIITKDSESWDDIAVPAYVDDDFDQVLCGYHLAQIRALADRLDGKYLFRAFRAHGLVDQFRTAATGVTRYGLGKYWLDNSVFPTPPVAEQRAIAAFLDRETGRIDALIGKKERQIELLREKRAALISHAVTKGLDPNAPMKDSGIEWLGQVPAQCEIKKLKYLTLKIGSGVTPKGGSQVYQSTGIPLLRSQNIHFDGLRLNDVAYIEKSVHDEMANSQLSQGDVLLNITGASIGRCFYWDNQFPEGNVNQHVCIIRPKLTIMTKYLCYCLSSFQGQSQIDSDQTGSGREGLNFESIKLFLFPIPSVNEELIKITTFLDRETGRIDAIIEKVQTSIDKLREYRTALISAAVTGKIDARG